MAHTSHAKSARAQTRLVPEEDPEFQIAPMIDILLVLLVFFMSISTSEILQVSEGVILPVAKDASPRDKNKKGEVIVNVLWNPINNVGSLEVGDTNYTQADQIAGILTAAVQANPETRILIRADRNVRYEYLRSVMAVAGKAGVGKVTFSVVDKDDGAAPAPVPAA
jgi:biopolymer transport protein ExbD